eukprot:108896-Chlamydomonas_euryale.AAC.1
MCQRCERRVVGVVHWVVAAAMVVVVVAAVVAVVAALVLVLVFVAVAVLVALLLLRMLLLLSPLLLLLLLLWLFAVATVRNKDLRQTIRKIQCYGCFCLVCGDGRCDERTFSEAVPWIMLDFMRNS